MNPNIQKIDILCNVTNKKFARHFENHRCMTWRPLAVISEPTPPSCTKLIYTQFSTDSHQPPPQALRFLHGRGESETSDWWWTARNHGKGTEGRRSPLSPSRLHLRAHFHQKRDVWVRGRTHTKLYTLIRCFSGKTCPNLVPRVLSYLTLRREREPGNEVDPVQRHIPV